MTISEFPDREIIVADKAYLYFGGTAYLGLPTHPIFIENLKKGLDKWGTFYGSSRNSNIQLSVYNKFEQSIAKQFETEAALVVSSGTLAGKLLLDYFSNSDYTFYHIEKTHPSILHGKSLPLLVNGELHPTIYNQSNTNIVITADAILALEVTPTSFSFLDKIPLEKKVTLIVDESHSLGIVGENGEGVFKTISNKNLERKIMVSSLGKALGISGGVIVADKNFIESLKKEPLFVGSSCTNSAYLEAYLKSQDLIQDQHKKLKENLNFLFNEITLLKQPDINYRFFFIV